MQSANDLKQLLLSINHKSYPAYKSTAVPISFRATHSPSTMSRAIRSPLRRGSAFISAAKPLRFRLFSTTHTKSASPSRITCLRQFARAIAPYSFRAKGSGKSGLLGISRCGQEILERTACVLNPSDAVLSSTWNRLPGQRPHHRLAGADPHSFRLSARLRRKITVLPCSGSESMRQRRPAL